MPDIQQNASPSGPEPISPAQLRELSLAEEREQRFSFALKLAAFNGFGLALCAAVVLLSGLFDLFSWLLAAALAALAYTELRGRKLLAAYERHGLTLLMRNQIALVALVSVYCASRIYFALSAENPLAEALQENADLAEALGTTDVGETVATYYRQAVLGLYVLVLLGTAAAQGACAFYYASRRKHLDAFLAQSPAWAVEWLRARASRRG